jgi:hypothetical protein
LHSVLGTGWSRELTNPPENREIEGYHGLAAGKAFLSKKTYFSIDF